MEWEVVLRGPESILEELAHALRQDENIIIRSTEGFILRSSRFVNSTDAPDVRSKATHIKEALSGISRMLLQSDAPLRIASLVEIRPDGTRNILVELEPGVLSIKDGLVSLQITLADGSIEDRRPSDPVPAWLTKALATPKAARALRLRDKTPLSWSDLYRLFEIIVDGVGGTGTIVNSGWASRTQLGRFTHSADSVSAAGDQARHGVERTTPPADPMTIAEARSLMDILLARWLANGAV